MLAVLPESRALRHRRVGGAAFSVAVHLALISVMLATTVGPSLGKPERPESVAVHFVPTPPPAPPLDATVPRLSSLAPLLAGAQFAVLRIPAPNVVPTTLPPVDLTHALSATRLEIGSGGAHGPGRVLSIVDGDDRPASDAWRGNELLMRIVTPATPRYPDLLRSANIEGRVLVRFGVDTLGRIDMQTVRILSSTHDLFSRAVLEALPGFHFKPSMIAGRRVPSLAEMPFEFQITK
jgi:protein TonB